MKTCKEVHRLVIEGQDRKLAFIERLGMRFHFMICAACRRFETQMSLIRSAVRRFPGE